MISKADKFIALLRVSRGLVLEDKKPDVDNYTKTLRK